MKGETHFQVIVVFYLPHASDNLGSGDGKDRGRSSVPHMCVCVPILTTVCKCPRLQNSWSTGVTTPPIDQLVSLQRKVGISTCRKHDEGSDEVK